MEIHRDVLIHHEARSSAMSTRLNFHSMCHPNAKLFGRKSLHRLFPLDSVLVLSSMAFDIFSFSFFFFFNLSKRFNVARAQRSNCNFSFMYFNLIVLFPIPSHFSIDKKFPSRERIWKFHAGEFCKTLQIILVVETGGRSRCIQNSQIAVAFV